MSEKSLVKPRINATPLIVVQSLFQFKAWLFWFAPAMLLATQLRAADAGPDFSKLAPVPPCADMVAAAQSRQIPLATIESPGEAGRLNPGDSFTSLVTLCEKGGRRTQWLLFLTALPASPRELARKTPKPMVLYSGRSNKLEYASAPTLVQLRTLGPFNAGTARGRKKLEDETACFSMNKGFLGLGLDRAAATVCRMGASNVQGAFWFGSSPPDATVAARVRKATENLPLTVEEEHALGGVFPAMFSYADIVEHTEGLQDLMMKVVDKPSIWSIVSHLGVTMDLIIDLKNFSQADLTRFGWSGERTAYHFPMVMKLNRDPALTVTLVVTNPRPPLLSCGGIVGMLAENPGDKDTYLTWWVISARYGHGFPD